MEEDRFRMGQQVDSPGNHAAADNNGSMTENQGCDSAVAHAEIEKGAAEEERDNSHNGFMVYKNVTGKAGEEQAENERNRAFDFHC